MCPALPDRRLLPGPVLGPLVSVRARGGSYEQQPQREQPEQQHEQPEQQREQPEQLTEL
jgi:hypothetical protein